MARNFPVSASASLAANTSDEMILEPKQILTFQEVAPVQEQTLPGEVELASELKTTAIEGRDHNIVDFLERIYKISDGSIPEGGASGDVLLSLVFPDVMLGLKQIANKISGFLNFRAGVEVTFVITAQPAQLGGLRLTYFPDVNDDQVALRSQDYLQLSQGPHITINIAKNQNSTITLPWISPYTHRNLVTGIGRNGTLILSRLTPSAGGVVNYQIYARFVNISIEYPTGMETAEETVIREQAAIKEKEQQAMIEELRFLRSKVKIVNENIQTEGLSESSKFLESGVLSQTASTVSNVAGMLSGLPVVGSIASAVSPIAGALSNIFSAFGWSKPVNDKPPAQMKIQPGTSSIQSDGVFNGHELTFMTGNTVCTDEGTFGSVIDEMSIDYIMRAPNTIDIFPISTEMPAGTVLARYPIDLCKWRDATIRGTYVNNDYYLTHQTMIAQLFRWWMGTIVFDFEAFMTKFHNVRLRFAVIPGATDSTDLSTVTIDDNNSSVVVFGDTVTYQAKCPEVSATPFLTVRGVTGALDGFRDQTLTTIGQMVVFLEVPLKATSTVAPTTVYVETKFHAVNVRLGLPSQARAYPIDNITTAIRTQGLSTAALYPAGDLPGRSDAMQTGDLVGINSDGSKPNGGILHATFGEMLRSIKQIILPFQYFGRVIGSTQGISVNPGATKLFEPGLLGAKPLNADIIDALMSMYAFYKGGFNVRIFSYDIDTSLYNVCLSPILAGPDRISGTTNITMGVPFVRTVPCVPFLEGFVELKVPYYQGTHMTRVTYNSDHSSNFLERSPLFVSLQRVTGDTILDPKDYVIQRAVGDDFSMGFLYALPPMQVAYNIAG